MNSTRTKTCLGAALALALCSCVSLEQPYPEKHFHLVEFERSSESSAIPASAALGSDIALRVAPFAISPGFEGRGLVYRRADGTFESDFYNEFFVSPAAMLTQLTRDWFAASELIATVVEPGSQLDPTHVIEGSVAKLYGDYSTNGAPEAVLMLELLALRRTPQGADIVMQQNYEIREPAQSQEPEALISAWGLGLQRALQQFENELQVRL